MYRLAYAVIFLTLAAFAPPAAPVYTWLKPGTVLVYEVDQMGKRYELAVTLKKLGPVVEMAYAASGGQQPKGSFSMPDKVIDTALAMVTVWPKENTVLGTQTCLLASRKILRNLQDGMQVDIEVDDQGEMLTADEQAIAVIMPLMKSKRIKLPALHVVGGLNDYRFSFLDYEGLPLLLSLDMGWTLKLKEIRPGS